MSRGPGRIERAIRELFDAHPDLAFVTDELVEHCFPGVTTIERKHQVSVLRAALKVVAGDPDWTAWRIDAQGCGWVFCNRDSATSRAFARGISSHIYRSEKRGARKKYDWVRVPGARTRLPYGTVLARWAERSGYPHNPSWYEQRVWQRDDMQRWMDGDEGQQACVDAAGATQQHRVHRDADETTRKALMEAEHAIWLRGPTVWAEWQKARATWASAPEVWLKRYPDVVDNGKETLTDITIIPPTGLSRLADRLRALMVQNDPDVLRANLAALAAELDVAADGGVR